MSRRAAEWGRLGLRLAIAVALVGAAIRVVLAREQRGLFESLRAAWVTDVPEALLWMALAWAVLDLAGGEDAVVLLLGLPAEAGWIFALPKIAVLGTVLALVGGALGLRHPTWSPLAALHFCLVGAANISFVLFLHAHQLL